MPGAKHWQFTINNPDNEQHDHLRSLWEERDSTDVVYLVYGEEVGASGTPHLQGHVSFGTRRSFNYVKGLFVGSPHLEMVRLLQRHIDYCKKDGSFREFGTSPLGQRSDSSRCELSEFRDTVASGVFASPELREKHPNVMARYPHFARSIVRDLFPTRAVEDFPLRPWQQDVVDYCAQPVHPREVLVVIDPRGNAGKTYLGRLLRSRFEETQILKPGKAADMAHAYKITTKLLIIDVPRSKAEHLQWSFVESVKDGCLFTSKYESAMLNFPPPHVLIFTNEEPDMSVLSEDRWKIIRITHS